MNNIKETKKISIRTACLHLLTVLKHAWLNILLFGMIYQLTTYLFLNLIIKKVITMAPIFGGYFVMTGDTGFWTNIIGVLLILVLIPLGILLIYFEFSALLIFLYAGFQKTKISFTKGSRLAIHSLGALYHWSTVGLALYTMCLLPLLQIGIHSSFIRGIRIPSFITDEILKYTGGALLLDLLMYLPILFFLLLIFILPCMALERLHFSDSLRRNFYLLKRNFTRTVVVFLIAGACWYLPILLLSRVDYTYPLLYSLAGVFIDICQFYSTPIILAAILVCFVANAKVAITLEEKSPKEKNSRMWARYIPSIIKKRPAILLLLLMIPAYLNTFDAASYSKVCLVIGHRGSLAGVENSTQAVLGAGQQNADYAEIDVQLSADHVPMVVHDTNLFRLSGEWTSVYECTAEQLKQVTLQQDEFVDYIPTLEALCKSTKGKVKLLIELKSHGHETASLVDEVVKIVMENGIQNDCIFQTSDYSLIKEMKAKYPYFKIGYIVIASMGEIPAPLLENIAADFLSVELSVNNRQLVNYSHNAGKEIYVWTVNDEDTVRSPLEMHVDGIITDYPKEVRQTMVDLRLIQ